MKDLIFRGLARLTPWWLARKHFWKKTNRGNDELFVNVSRRNSKSKQPRKHENPSPNVEDVNNDASSVGL